MYLPGDLSLNSAGDSSSGGISRRGFLKTASIGAQMLAMPAWARVLGANDRINVALIGAGMRCQGLIGDYRRHRAKQDDFEFAAVCDIWEPRLKYTQEQTKAPKTLRDYREVLQQPDIDGVVHVKSKGKVLPGSIVSVVIEKSDAYDLFGRLAAE